MIKTIEIIDVIPFNLKCKFNNGDIRQINLESFIQNANDSVIKKKLLDPFFFKQVKIGELGQLYWTDAAFFQDENGERMICEFDISPEFIYNNSIKL